MARGAWDGCRLLSHKLGLSPHAVISHCLTDEEKEDVPKKSSLALEKRDWENTVCSVCMEFPHNAVLLLCSSHDKGCRPYMCDTSYCYSNCLDQFKKAYTKEAGPHDKSAAGPTCGSSEVMELMCPLCRGQVKGWTVVEPAREYLNRKKRICMQDNCSFTGAYKRLRKHLRAKHASAKPRKVDPVFEHKWKTLEYQREREDVMSMIRSSMPSSLVVGDYVIDMSDSNNDSYYDGSDSDSSDGVVFDRRINRRVYYGRGSNRRASRNTLRGTVREGTHVARIHQDDGVPEGWDVGGGHSFPMSADGGRGGGGAADVAVAFPCEADDYVSYVGFVRTDRRQLHRRRSHGRS